MPDEPKQKTWGERINEIRELFESNQDKIFGAAEAGVNRDRYTEAMMHAIGNTKDLSRCTNASLVRCLTESATLGLVIGSELGYGYALPRNVYEGNGNNRKIVRIEAEFQPGYKGIRKLCYDSPRVVGCTAQTVFDFDFCEVMLGTNPEIVHKPALRKDRGNPIGYYGIVKLERDLNLICYQSIQQIEDHVTKYCKGADRNGSAWKTSRNPMAEKTCLNAAMKHAPMRSELAQEVIGRGQADFEAVVPESFPSGTEASVEPMDKALAALNGDGPNFSEAPDLFGNGEDF